MPASDNPTAPRRQYRVYVVRLDPKVLNERGFLRANPQHDPRKSCVYVGSTGLPPEERFIQHKNGIKANKFAKVYGLGLMRSLMERRTPARTQLIAVRQEAAFARRLRKAGYAVWPKEEAYPREIAKLEAKRREKLAERARKAREHRREQAIARRASSGGRKSPIS
jgi:hypothetical protein